MDKGNLKPLQCPTCKRVYTQRTMDNYMTHLRTCGKGDYECDKCGKKFFTQQITESCTQHTLGPVHACSVCKRNFDTNLQLVRHSRIHKDKPEPEKDQLKYEYCDKTFAWKSSLSRHLQSHFDSEMESFLCGCGKKFKNYSACYNHKKHCIYQFQKAENVEYTSTLSGESAVHCCQFCKKGFKDRFKLNEHVVECDPFPFVEDSVEQKSVNEKDSTDVQQSSSAYEEHGINGKKVTPKHVPGKSKEVSNQTETINLNTLLKEENAKETVFSVNGNASTDKQNDTVNKASDVNESETSVRRTGRVRKPKKFPEFNVESPEYEKIIRLSAPVEKDIKRKPTQHDLKSCEADYSRHSTKETEKGDEKKDKAICFVQKKVKVNKTNKGIEIVILPVDDSAEREGKVEHKRRYKRKHNDIGLASKLLGSDPKCPKKKADTANSSKPRTATNKLRQETQKLLKDKILQRKFKLSKNHLNRSSDTVCQVEPPKCVKATVKCESEKSSSGEKEHVWYDVNLDTELKSSGAAYSVEKTSTVCQKLPPKCVKATVKSKIEQSSCSEIKMMDLNKDSDCKLNTNDKENSMEGKGSNNKKNPSEYLQLSTENIEDLSRNESETKESVSQQKKREAFLIHYYCKTENCSEKFKSLKEIMRHKKMSHREYFRYVCSACSKEFRTFALYRTHLRMDHSNLESVPLYMKSTDIVVINKTDGANKKYLDILVCTKCGYRYKESEDPAHDCKPVGLLYFCPCCTFCSRSREKITQHISIEHAGQCYEARYKNQYTNLKCAPRLPGFQVDESCTRCDQCDSQFETNKQLMKHIEYKHAHYPFACGFCMACYGRKPTLNVHLKQHLRLQFKCEICQKEFFEQFLLNKHMVLHTTERQHQCDVCGNRYCDEKTLKKHMMLKHKNHFRASFPDSSLGETDKINLEPLQHICHICGKTYNMAKYLNRHMKTHNGKHFFKCAECGKTFATKMDFSKHKQTHAIVNVSSKDDIGQNYTIPSKDKDMSKGIKRFEDMYKGIKRFEEGHPAGLPYSCSLCNKRFSVVKSINQHIRTVHMQDKDKAYTCSVCEKGFPFKASFRNHLRLHTNSRPYRCRICRKRFKQVGHVREHMLIHGEAMLSCKLCGRNFKNRGLLRAHVILHSNILPYKCPSEHCTLAFHSLFQLWEHFSICAKSVKKDSLLNCGICQQVCNKDTIMLHYQSHEKDAHFRCDVCGVSFKTYSLLYFHKDGVKHFTESELSNNSKSHIYTFKHNEPVCIKGVSREDLMSQYDYIEQEDEVPLGFAVENYIDMYKEQTNKTNGMENPSGELLGIADQMTPMESGIQFKEVNIHGSKRIEDDAIGDDIMEANVKESQLQAEDTPTQYKEIIVHAALQNEDENLETIILDEGSQEIKINEEDPTQTEDLNFQNHEKSDTLTYGNYSFKSGNKLTASELTANHFRASLPDSSLGEIDEIKLKPLQHICHICGKTYNMVKYLNKHIKTHNVKQLFKCAECGKLFATKMDFNKHKQTHALLNVSSKDDIGQNYTIPSKDKDMYKGIKRFEDMYKGIKRFEAGHPAGLPYSCSLCNKRFSVVKSINQHIRTVHMQDKDKAYTCSVCEKGFPFKASFRNHLRLHTNSRPYRCRICRKRFKQVGHVREHMLIHGEAMLSCKLCGRNFKNRGLLRAHVTLHSNILPYKCPVEHCTLAFRSLFQLWEHFSVCAKSVKKDSLLNCGICQQVCNKDTIMLHYQSHEKDAHFRCDVCGVSFKTYSLLYFHKDGVKHFTESELSNNSKSHIYTFKHNEPVCIKGASREDLMSQYDYIEQEDEVPLGFAVENYIDMYKEQTNKTDGMENPSGELLGIAEQMTHMASGIQYKEVIIHGSNRIEDDAIGTDIMEVNVEESQLQAEDTPTQYKEIIVHAALQNEDENLETIILDEGSQEIKINEEDSTQTEDLNFQNHEKSETLTYGNYSIKSGNKLTASELTASALNNTGEKSKSQQDCVSETANENIVTREQALGKTSDGVAADSECNTFIEENIHEEIVEYSHPHLSVPVRFVDKTGNEIIVLVINEQGEHIQVTNSEEILDTVVKNEDYTILENTGKDSVTNKDVDNTATQDNKLGNHSSHKKSKNLNTVNVEQLETSTETQRPSQNQRKREVKNLDKIQGTFDQNLDDSMVDEKVKVDLKFYEERSNELPVKCSICSKGFRSVKARNLHEKSHLKNSERKYQCEECGAGFHLPNKLHIHKRIHTQERPYKCTHCNKSYSQQGHLRTHLRTHLNYYPFHCNMCDMKFTANSNLKIHVIKKHGIKNEKKCCQCSICDLYLKDEVDLKIHKLWHLAVETRLEFLSNCNGIEDVQVGEYIYEEVKGYKNKKDIIKHPHKLKNYVCETCGINLRGEALFNAHQAVHNTTTDPLPCKYCDLVFTERSALDKHMKNHSEFTVMCKICGSYVKEQLMRNHLARHENKFARNYQCKVCGKQVKSEYTFMRHVVGCSETEIDMMLQGLNDHIKVEQDEG